MGTDEDRNKSYPTNEPPVQPERDELWETEDGRLIPVARLDVDHLRNIVRMIIRKKRRYQHYLTLWSDQQDMED